MHLALDKIFRSWDNPWIRCSIAALKWLEGNESKFIPSDLFKPDGYHA
jgi:hypothetical protein